MRTVCARAESGPTDCAAYLQTGVDGIAVQRGTAGQRRTAGLTAGKTDTDIR